MSNSSITIRYETLIKEMENKKNQITLLTQENQTVNNLL